jgi:membrane-associated protease RseP (regulator of RpoE activity)
MSAVSRYWSFAAVLGAGVVTAIAGLGAQAASPPGQPVEARELIALDGRGSRLGVMVRDLEDADLSAAPNGGVRIDEVDAGGPADKAGLKPGDVVIEYDGERVRSARQFSRLVQETPEGRPVPMAVVRNGQRESLTATPEARALALNVDIDGDRLRADVERGLRGLDGLREFHVGPPTFNFRFDRIPGGMAGAWSNRAQNIMLC